jgi:hypothetical protein
MSGHQRENKKVLDTYSAAHSTRVTRVIASGNLGRREESRDKVRYDGRSTQDFALGQSDL